MESVIKQLVKIGHGMSAEVANDEPAVAKLLVELSSALDVQYERSNALEAKCASLAAENAGLKEWSPNPHSASMFEAIEKAEAHMDDGMPELAMVEAFEILKMKRTPATDSFLAEVRAQGVEMFAKHCQKLHGEMMKSEPNEAASNAAITATRRAGEFAMYFAAQLRKGAAQ